MKCLKIISVLIGILFLHSCEKVIDFDLTDSEKAIVIEAILASGKSPFTVTISKTTPYFETNAGDPVSGAKVSLRTENGTPRYCKETSAGTYSLERSTKPTNTWYIVDVVYNGITYTAKAYLNDPVPISDLSFSYFDGLGVLDSGYKVHCYIHDPQDKENYYRIKYYVNGKIADDDGEITLYSDELFNGKEIGLGQRSKTFGLTDTLTIELQSIDKAAYDYFSTLENITSEDWLQSASPANPISNFNNGALGYFSAYSFDRKKVVIKDFIKE